jgi:hypothetical protein
MESKLSEDPGKSDPAAGLSDRAIEAIVKGLHGDPFAVLGPHQVTPLSWEVRAMLPRARWRSYRRMARSSRRWKGVISMASSLRASSQIIGPSNRRRFFVVLHIPPITSPALAVRAAIVAQVKSEKVSK